RADDLLVPTLYGPVLGLDLHDHREWRGIPYAQAERWKRPVAPDAWRADGPLPGQHFGAHCPQPGEFDPTFFNESCLFLNVSVPPGAAAGAKLPVIVDVHGGGDVVGWGREATSALVQHGVIVVTLNYRLGVLGFLALPQ